MTDLPLALQDDFPSEAERWAEYERRKTEWEAANPGAWPGEYETVCARIVEELGL